ncbi:hypothetical protein DIPPA_08745 [Diplonema papillatum]|nr:hypothetical protein DIPPA_08745 [Diplonema papillatum]
MRRVLATALTQGGGSAAFAVRVRARGYAAAAAPGADGVPKAGEDDGPAADGGGKMTSEELEQMRERQRWQDRYEFTDEEIEEELRGESAWRERYRGVKNWLRYHFNLFESHENLTVRRERWKVLSWKDLRTKKALLGAFLLVLMIYGDFVRDKLLQKMRDLQQKGAGADWPTHYIALKEIHEGRRSLDQILKHWDRIRDAHQRDWLLPLLAGQVLVNFGSDPPVLRSSHPQESVLERLAEELTFVEADVSTMSAEIALHLNNLLTGEVKWPGPPPNAAVKKEIADCIDCMASFKIHPVLVERIQARKNETRTFFGGTGYFESTAGDLEKRTIAA